MKKFLKCCFSFVLALTVVFSFTACKTKLSKTTVDSSKVKVINGVSTNGGITAVYGDYLYFINGTKTNDGTSLTKNKRSAICRVKYNTETGKVSSSTYEVVVDSLVGFDNGSMHFFGDFLYYTTPCDGKDKTDATLHNMTEFKRYDLVNKKSYDVYTTKQNSAEEEISFAYYVVGNSLNLVVYEKTNKTITSLKIGDEIKTNYVIEDVESCVLSENYGKCVTAGATVDANNYVFYTKAHEQYEYPYEGVKVYQASPNSNSKECISDEGKDVTLLCIRAGKLIYSVDTDNIYAQAITGLGTADLTFSFANQIAHESAENVVFMENADGSISILTCTEESIIALYKWNNSHEIEYKEIAGITKAEKFEFVTVTTIEEVVVEDDEETTDVDETDKDFVQYAIYIADGAVYKIELARGETADTMELAEYSQAIKLTVTSVNMSSGLLVPEVIGNFLFIYAADDDKNVYLYKTDITIKVTDTVKKADQVSIKE